MTPANRTPRQLRGKHVLFALLGFFGVMLAANGIFVYLALTTFSGIETDDAYRKGLAYNEQLAEVERQAGRGWKSEIVASGGPGSLAVSVADRGGFPVAGLHVDALVGRPSTDRFDRRLRLAETQPGTYTGRLAEAPPGAWIVAITARRETAAGPRVMYRAKERIWLKPTK